MKIGAIGHKRSTVSVAIRDAKDYLDVTEITRILNASSLEREAIIKLFLSIDLFKVPSIEILEERLG